MSDLKPLEIAHQFIQKLLSGNTGNRNEFACYLGISPCRVTVYKHKIECIYKVKIEYSRKRDSYFVNTNDTHKLPPPLFRIAINYLKKLKSVWQLRTGLYLHL